MLPTGYVGDTKKIISTNLHYSSKISERSVADALAFRPWSAWSPVMTFVPGSTRTRLVWGMESNGQSMLRLVVHIGLGGVGQWIQTALKTFVEKCDYTRVFEAYPAACRTVALFVRLGKNWLLIIQPEVWRGRQIFCPQTLSTNLFASVTWDREAKIVNFCGQNISRAREKKNSTYLTYHTYAASPDIYRPYPWPSPFGWYSPDRGCLQSRQYFDLRARRSAPIAYVIFFQARLADLCTSQPRLERFHNWSRSVQGLVQAASIDSFQTRHLELASQVDQSSLLTGQVQRHALFKIIKIHILIYDQINQPKIGSGALDLRLRPRGSRGGVAIMGRCETGDPFKLPTSFDNRVSCISCSSLNSVSRSIWAVADLCRSARSTFSFSNSTHDCWSWSYTLQRWSSKSRRIFNCFSRCYKNNIISSRAWKKAWRAQTWICESWSNIRVCSALQWSSSSWFWSSRIFPIRAANSKSAT